MKRIYGLALVLLLLGLALPTLAQDAQTPAQICQAAAPAPGEPADLRFAQAEQVLEPGVDYRAVLCTDAGPIYIDLFEGLTPVTVNSFVFLAQEGFYNNTTFHRVIEGFMAQGGDPTGTGTGGPGYQFEDEPIGFLTFDTPGWLAMANAGPGTNGSQFFITTVPTEHLNYQHTIFGDVLEGQDAVAAIELRDPATATGPGTRLQTVVIITDPASVQTAFEDAASLPQEQVVTAFGRMAESITPDIAEILRQETTEQATADVIAAAPEAAQDTLSALLEAYGHEYRIGNIVTNVACQIDNNLVFAEIRYMLDSFPTREEAAAALADERLAQALVAGGFEQQTAENLPNPLFTRSETLCERDMVRGLTYWQRGHFLATAEIAIPVDSEMREFLDLLLGQFVALRVYEPILIEALRPEIR